MLTVMSGSMNSNIESVFSDIPLLKAGLGHISFCADDKLAEDLDSEGHIDHHVRKAISLGVKPMAAYRMATLNAASYYRLDHLIGSITPGKLADLLILDNLEDARSVEISSILPQSDPLANSPKAHFCCGQWSSRGKK